MPHLHMLNWFAILFYIFLSLFWKYIFFYFLLLLRYLFIFYVISIMCCDSSCLHVMANSHIIIALSCWALVDCTSVGVCVCGFCERLCLLSSGANPLKCYFTYKCQKNWMTDVLSVCSTARDYGAQSVRHVWKQL